MNDCRTHGTYAIVDVGRATNDDTIIDDAHLGVNVEFLLHKVLLLALPITIPRLLRYQLLLQHGILRNRIRRFAIVAVPGLLTRALKSPPLVNLSFLPKLAGIILDSVQPMSDLLHAASHDFFGIRSLHCFVVNTRQLLLPFHRRCLVEPIVRAEIEEEDVLGRVDAFLLDLTHDGVLSATDGLVLVVHDCTRACCGVLSEIAGEPGNGGNNADHAKLATLLSRSHASVHNRSSDRVVHR